MTKPTPTEGTPLRDAANVIADAVQSAKDEKIAQAEHELEQAEQLAKESRDQLGSAMRAARRLNRAIIEAGEAFEEAMRRAIDGSKQE